MRMMNKSEKKNQNKIHFHKDLTVSEIFDNNMQILYHAYHKGFYTCFTLLKTPSLSLNTVPIRSSESNNI